MASFVFSSEATASLTSPLASRIALFRLALLFSASSASAFPEMRFKARARAFRLFATP